MQWVRLSLPTNRLRDADIDNAYRYQSAKSEIVLHFPGEMEY